VIVNPVIVTGLPDTMLFELSTMSVVQLPWMWQFDEPSNIRNEAAVPLAPAPDTDHVPVNDAAPDADVRNVAGRVIVASVPDGLAAAQFAGSAPL
jgi:hypothetical protein